MKPAPIPWILWGPTRTSQQQSMRQSKSSKPEKIKSATIISKRDWCLFYKQLSKRERCKYLLIPEQFNKAIDAAEMNVDDSFSNFKVNRTCRKVPMPQKSWGLKSRSSVDISQQCHKLKYGNENTTSKPELMSEILAMGHIVNLGSHTLHI